MNEVNYCFFEEISKIDNTLTIIIKKKKRKTSCLF